MSGFHSIVRRSLFLISAGFLWSASFAQGWNASLMISPFPSPYASDWQTNPSAVGTLIIFNPTSAATQVRIRMTVSLSGTGEVFKSLGDAINLPALPSVVLDNTKIAKFEDASFPKTDIQRKVLRSGRLLEGQYTACISLESVTGQVLVGNVCSNFTILYPEPPHLIYPMNGDSLDASAPFPMFQWTPVVVPPQYQIRYILKIVEVLPGQVPQQALNANVPHYVNNNVTTTSFLYPIDALPLETGKKYAWQVQTLDQNGFPASQNQGKSEIFTFSKKSKDLLFFPIAITAAPQLVEPSKDVVLNSKTPKFSWTYSSTKTVQYRVRVTEILKGQTPDQATKNTPLFNQLVAQSSFTPSVPLSLGVGKSYAWQVQVLDPSNGSVISTSDTRTFSLSSYLLLKLLAQLSSVTGKLYYEFADPGEYITWPLPNVTVKLVVKYMLKYNSYTGGGSYKGHMSKTGTIFLSKAAVGNPSDFDKTLGVTKTDANGNFAFSYVGTDSMGLIKKNFHLVDPGEFGYNYGGDLYRVARVIVESPYYTSPDQDIIVQPGESKNYAQLIAGVRSYALTATLKSPNWENQALPKNTPISQMKVYLLRKNRPGEVPANEGLPRPQQPEVLFSGYEIIGKGNTGAGAQMGKVTFKRLVKSIYSQNDEYFIYALSDTEKSTFSYGMLIPWKFKFTYGSDKALFFAEYQYPTVPTDVVAIPVLPAVRGRVKRMDGGKPLAGATVKLLNYAVFFWAEEKNMPSDGTGAFGFEKLTNKFDNNGGVTGPLRGLKITMYGYRDTTMAVPANGAILKPGDTWFKEIALQPNAIIKGKIVDEEGNGIAAKVSLIGGETKDAKPPPYIVLETMKWAPASFEILSPKGSQQLIIDPTPYDASYFRDTVGVSVSSDVTDVGTIQLKRKLHRVRVVVYEKLPDGVYIVTPKKIVGANVRLEGGPGQVIAEAKTDAAGNAEFAFANSASSFTLVVTAPAGQNYEGQSVQTNIPEGKEPVIRNVYLKKAAFIAGHVFVGKQNQPVSNVRVRLNVSGSSVPIETLTGTDGSYMLPNVPIGKNTFSAAKKNSNYIGDQKSLNVPAAGLQNVDFNLKVYEEMDITHLMGFPIEVANLVEAGGQVKISGEFIDLDSLKNGQFQSTSKTLKFSNVAVVPSELKSMLFGKEVPVAKPAVLPLKTDENSMGLSLYENFPASLSDSKIGIELSGEAGGSGVIKGMVNVPNSAFSIPSTKLTFPSGGFYLKVPGFADLRIPVITASMKDPAQAPNGFLIVDAAGKSVQYKLYDFSAHADSANSYVSGDSVRLRTIVHTNIAHVTPSDIALDIGTVTLSKTEINPIVGGLKPIAFQLDQWTLELKQWVLNGYFAVTGGTLKTTVVDVPVKELHITPTQLLDAKFDMKSMSIGGVIPLTVAGKSTLSFDNTISSWYLWVEKGSAPSAASFGGLPGMKSGDSVAINSFTLYSNGKQALSPVANSIALHKVGIFTPDQIVSGNNFVEMSTVTFDIPKLKSALNARIQYYKEGGVIKLKLVPVEIKLETNGVKLAFSTDFNTEPEFFDEQGLRARGKVSEEGKFSLNAWLYHTTDSTSVWVETPQNPLAVSKNWQTLGIGSNLTYFDKVTGTMKAVSASSWNNFVFSGDLIVPKGVKEGKNRLTFTVVGAIKANGQELGVTNIDSPFGGMSWTYEFENKRLVGTVHIDQKLLGNATVVGDANCIVDGDGWYFLAGGALSLPTPKLQGQVGILFGDHPMTSEIKSTFQQFSWVYQNKGHLPPTFPSSSVSGFFAEGEISLPIPIVPSFDFDFGLVSAHLHANVGGDVRLKMEFASDGNTYGVGMDQFIDIDAGLGASVGFACAGVSASLLADVAYEGQYKSNGEWFVDGDASLTLSGSTYKGVGACDSECGDLSEVTPCFKDSKGASIKVGVQAHYGSDDKFVKVYLK